MEEKMRVIINLEQFKNLCDENRYNYDLLDDGSIKIIKNKKVLFCAKNVKEAYKWLNFYIKSRCASPTKNKIQHCKTRRSDGKIEYISLVNYLRILRIYENCKKIGKLKFRYTSDLCGDLLQKQDGTYVCIKQNMKIEKIKNYTNYLVKIS